MTSLPRPVATICALLLAVTSPAAQAQLYDITDLGDVAPASINASGVIVGYAPLSGSATGFRAFVLDNGVLTLLPTHVDIPQSSPPEASFMRAYDVNKRGQVVGLAVVPSTTIGGVWGSGEVVAFLYEKGKTTFFAFPEGGVNHSSAYAISDKGLVAGLIYTPNPRGVLYDLKTGQQTTLSPLGGETAFSISINDVNDAGVAVGGSNLNAEENHAFRYMARDGSLEDLGTLGGNVSGANAINDRGTIVGVSTTTANESHAVLWKDNVLHDLGTLGGTSGTPYGINKAGTVVGLSGITSGAQHAFTTLGGSMVDLNLFLPAGSDWELLGAFGINDAGQIIGVGSRNGVQHGFLLTPTRRPTGDAP